MVGVFAIIVSMLLAAGGVDSAYKWFNSFMGLVLGILMGTFVLGAFTKRGNTFGAVCGFIASSAVMIWIVYGLPKGTVSIWANSIIALAVSMAVGYPASLIYSKVTGKKSEPAPNTTIYNIEK